jgi:hypothetical protein
MTTHHLATSPELQALLAEQDREVLRMLLRAAKNAGGPLDLAAIERSIEALMRRIEMRGM